MPQRSIYRIFSRGCIYKAKHRSGRPRMTNKLDDRRIQRLASTQQMTVPENQRSSGLLVSKDRIRRRSLEERTMVHCKVKEKPALKPQIMLWARNHVSYGSKWQPVIFSDDKE
ncbi:hypothetical protein AVEN_143414-1 [Araneus ventricosus]|uniref:Transposase Tc1-like domain-containing protein n=1 Tax=Araneus ventricosus TaxID=182803 RepID=A0A4Y2AEB1_ARAVE|nr:hypothetical protein AVEN_143414-1 [Araneus ventricosus]